MLSSLDDTHSGRRAFFITRITDYIHTKDNSIRYTLGKYYERPLIFFGINPSIASDKQNDATISIVEKISRSRGYDGYLMLNLYPLRATKITNVFPAEYDSAVYARNLGYISERIYSGAELVAAWGTHIGDRPYFIEALTQINQIAKEKHAKWICLNKTKAGHPHHPTRLAYHKMTFEHFDMDCYIRMLKKEK